jgi:hypothetical protein
MMNHDGFGQNDVGAGKLLGLNKELIMSAWVISWIKHTI